MKLSYVESALLQVSTGRLNQFLLSCISTNTTACMHARTLKPGATAGFRLTPNLLRCLLEEQEFGVNALLEVDEYLHERAAALQRHAVKLKRRLDRLLRH